MKKALFILAFILPALAGQAQTTRYFEFRTACGYGNWQDTTFIASATNQVLIDTVLANLTRPLNQRKFIRGYIDNGNGGHNHNASHWFLWHFIPDQWDLVELAMEVCDGCPYSDIDADTAYWIGLIGEFCPWTSIPVREVSSPVGLADQSLKDEIFVYPNPARDNVTIGWNNNHTISVAIYNSIGQELRSLILSKHNPVIDISGFMNGIYILKITDGYETVARRIIIEG